MKLKEKYIVNGSMGLPDVPYEVWDLGDKYWIDISMEEGSYGFNIHAPDRNITYEVAKYLDVDTDPVSVILGTKGADGRELYLVNGIDCAGLNYTKPENYMELLLKIEKIVNEHFKNKEKN